MGQAIHYQPDLLPSGAADIIPLAKSEALVDALAVVGALDAVAIHLPEVSKPIREYVRDTVSKTLARRGIKSADLQMPRMQIFGPAVEVLRYASAREEIANIIAASMDTRTGYRVLPSYVEVMKQMSQDELHLLRQAPRLGVSVPISHVNLVLPTNQAIVVYRNVIPEALASGCEFRRNIPQYIDNLMRLGILVFRPEDEARETVYRTLAKIRFVRSFLVGAPHGSRIAMTPSAFALTDFGEGVRSACFD